MSSLLFSSSLSSFAAGTARRVTLASTKAMSYGMVTLRTAGMQFAYQGMTTVDEVVRETILDA